MTDPRNIRFMCIPIVGDGDTTVPESIRAALAFAARQANDQMTLRSGETALFYHLIAIINMHSYRGRDASSGPTNAGSSAESLDCAAQRLLRLEATGATLDE